MVSHCKILKLRSMIRLACFYSSSFCEFSLQIRRRQPKRIELIKCTTQVWCKILQHAYCSQLSSSGLHSHPCRGFHYLCCAPLHSLLFQWLREKAKASELTCFRDSTETDYKRLEDTGGTQEAKLSQFNEQVSRIRVTYVAKYQGTLKKNLYAWF